jgi:hypothetical protein
MEEKTRTTMLYGVDGQGKLLVVSRLVTRGRERGGEFLKRGFEVGAEESIW